MADPLPPEAFFAPPVFSVPKLAPDGNRYASLLRFDDRHQALVLMDIGTGQQETLIKADDLSVSNYWWKNDQWLLVLVEHDSGRRFFRTVDLKAKKSAELESLGVYPMRQILHLLPSSETDVLFSVRKQNTEDYNLVRIDLTKDKLEIVERAPKGLLAWYLNDTGQVVAVWGREHEQHYIARPQGGKNWEKKMLSEKTGLSPIVPLGVAPDGRRLIVRDDRAGGTGIVGYWEPFSDEFETIVSETPFEAATLQRWGPAEVAVGIDFMGPMENIMLPNPEIEASWAWLQKSLAGTRISLLSFSADGQGAMVYAQNERNAGVYCRVDFAARKVVPLAAASPQLKPATMVPSQVIQFPTRAGGKVLGEVWLPTGIERPPLVVLVGSSLRPAPPNGGFNTVAQFLANRGFAVVKVHHRGGVGLGAAYALAGDFEVVTGIVDDLEDAVRGLIAATWVDGDRVAVWGEEFGALSAVALVADRQLGNALVTINTSLDTGRWAVDTLARSGRTEEELLELAGGWAAVKEMRTVADPMPRLVGLAAPSFHYFTRAKNGYGDDYIRTPVNKLRQELVNHKRDFEIMTDPTFSEQERLKLADWRMRMAYIVAAAAFLEARL